MADLVSLVRFALHRDDALVPHRDIVMGRFERWMAQQPERGRAFTPEQARWLELIRDHVATSLGIRLDDFDYAPFAEEGGLGKATQVFGSELRPLLEELNEVLAA
jgi:type I restriction enzyme R subunit